MFFWCYGRSSCIILMRSTIAEAKCIFDFLCSYLRLFVVENDFMWGVTILLKMFLCAASKTFLRNGSAVLWRKIAFHWNLLQMIFCYIFLDKNVQYHRTQFREKCGLYYLYKDRCSICYKNRCNMIQKRSTLCCIWIIMSAPLKSFLKAYVACTAAASGHILGSFSVKNIFMTIVHLLSKVLFQPGKLRKYADLLPNKYE